MSGDVQFSAITGLTVEHFAAIALLSREKPPGDWNVYGER
jgi:hypothetical protein